MIKIPNLNRLTKYIKYNNILIFWKNSFRWCRFGNKLWLIFWLCTNWWWFLRPKPFADKNSTYNTFRIFFILLPIFLFIYLIYFYSRYFQVNYLCDVLYFIIFLKYNHLTTLLFCFCSEKILKNTIVCPVLLRIIFPTH